MKATFETFSPNWVRRGLTLVEVLAAIVILGTLLAGMVMAKAHHTRQIALTRERLKAMQIADELIAGWWQSPEGPPVNQRGTLAGDWNWETHIVANPAIEGLGARVLRVEVRPAESQASRLNDDTLVVDLVLPDPEKLRDEARAALATQPARANGGEPPLEGAEK